MGTLFGYLKKNKYLVCSLIFIVSLLTFTSETIFSASSEFITTDIEYIAIAFLLISALFLILPYISDVLSNKVGIAINVMTGGLFAASVFSINWLMVEELLLLPTTIIIFIYGLVSYLAFIILNLSIKPLICIALVLTINLTFNYGKNLYVLFNETTETMASKNMAPYDITTNPYFSEIEDVIFDEKPNVYFISFDSIQPKSLTSKYMGIEEAPFHPVMYDRMDIFKNLFAVRVPSSNALNLIMEMHVNNFDNSGKRKKGFFSGKSDGRLSAIFKNNGYEINTLYKSDFFGSNKGPFVDRYMITSKNNISACYFIDSDFTAISLFGLCRLTDLKIIEPEISTGLFDFLSYLSQQHKPQFLLSYVYSPGHTKKDFQIESEKDVEEYSAFYLRRSVETQNTMKKVLDKIAQNDPDAIVYFFGDHGPWRSRGKKTDRFLENPKFYVHDRHGILGGIFPKGRCKSHVDNRNKAVFTTSIQGAEAVLKCLTKGKYEEIKQDYTVWPNRKSFDGVSIKFEDYTYE